ncbi:protein Mpv17 [Pectinophora gossypiella]|uniref:protein Mpv17 n=1 Tax=Pectinophora gossypiella TaxID=13191 RepID=UPI00214F33A0|nr:protein Mpv17 [Pectinophora gossypiella]
MSLVTMQRFAIFRAYQRVLSRRPYLVQAIQTGALMGAGDLISQTIIEKKSFKQIEWQRSARFSCIGLFIIGPTLRVWYGVLNKHIGHTGKTVAVKKVFLDQVVFAPMVLCSLLCIVGASQGKNWDSIKQDLNTNYIDILKANYMLWPWVQLLNFYYIPLHYQVLFVQCVALFWNTYLAWKTNKICEKK